MRLGLLAPVLASLLVSAPVYAEPRLHLDLPSEVAVTAAQLAAVGAVHGPSVLALPVLFAGGFTFPGGSAVDANTPPSGTYTVTGAVSAGGYIAASATAPAGTNAYWNYDGTNLVGNVP